MRPATKDDVKSSVKISHYLTDMGIRVCGGRAIAKWRDGKHPNVSVNDERGRWKDFKTGESGDIFNLFMKVEGGDFTTALRSLAERYNVVADNGSPAWRPQRRTCPAEPPAEPLTQEDRDFIPITMRGYSRSANTATTSIITNCIRSTDDDLHLDEAEYRAQAARQLRSMFKERDLIWAGWIIKDAAVRARLGFRLAKTPIKPASGDNIFDHAVRAGIIKAHVLADRIENGIVAEIPTHVSLNPVMGRADGDGSYDSAGTIAEYRHVLIEFDDLCDLGADGIKTPSSDHINIIAGLLDYAADNPNTMRSVCATYTGGKSIHVALSVNADGACSFKQRTDNLYDHFTSATDKSFHADPAGWNNGYTHIRLAGAIRPETGKRARLLMPFTSRPCSDAAATMCGVCERFSICGFRHPDAVRGSTILRTR